MLPLFLKILCYYACLQTPGTIASILKTTVALGGFASQPVLAGILSTSELPGWKKITAYLVFVLKKGANDCVR